MDSDENKLPAALLIMGKKSIYKFNQPVIRVGRSRENDLIIDHSKVSRTHAKIRYTGDRFEITDLESMGGTYVNGERISRQILSKGDVITLADFHLVFGQEEFPVVKAPIDYETPQDMGISVHDTSIILRKKT